MMMLTFSGQGIWQIAGSAGKTEMFLVMSVGAIVVIFWVVKFLAIAGAIAVLMVFLVLIWGMRELIFSAFISLLGIIF
jgi:hypothetical protein